MSLYLSYSIKPTIAIIVIRSPLGVSLILSLLSLLIWTPISFWSIRRKTFPTFQIQYGLEKSGFRNFSKMNIFNKKRKPERWKDRKASSSFDFKKQELHHHVMRWCIEKRSDYLGEVFRASVKMTRLVRMHESENRKDGADRI